MRKLRAELDEVEPLYKGKAVFYEENGDAYRASFEIEWDGALNLEGDSERFNYLNERYSPQEVSGALKSALQDDLAAGTLAKKDADQLALEIYVSNLDRSIEFYTALGFTLKRREEKFALLMWMDRILMLDERKGPLGGGNLRVLVEDVDHYWESVEQMGLTVLSPIGDRYYGLRDFTIADPDGFGLRFASRLMEDE